MTITKRYRKILLLTTPSLTELIEPVYEDVVLSNEDSLCSLDDTENIVLDIRLSPQDKTERFPPWGARPGAVCGRSQAGSLLSSGRCPSRWWL